MRRLLALVLAITFLAAPAAAAAPAFSISDARGSEGGQIVFTITKSAKASSYSKIVFTTHGGRSATYGVDFVPLSITLTFANSELVKTVAVQTVQDPLVEGDEVFTAAITASRFAAIARGAATGTIVDDDAIPPPPPPPPPAPARGTALALQACSALNRAESLVVGRTYIAVEFGHEANGAEFVVLSDDTHRGDGYFALYVPVVCVQLG